MSRFAKHELKWISTPGPLHMIHIHWKNPWLTLELPRKNRTILWSFAQKFGPQDQKHRSPLHLCIQPCWGTAGSFSGPCAIQPWTPSTPRFDQKDLRGRNRRMSMVPWQFGVRSFRLYTLISAFGCGQRWRKDGDTVWCFRNPSKLTSWGW